MIPTDTIDILQDCWQSLSKLGAELTEAEWKTATDLPGWSVQDNLSHLIGIERMMQGFAATEHRAVLPDYIRNPIGQMNEHEVDARRSSTGAEVLREWNELVAVRLQTLRAGDEAYFAQPAITPTGPGTLADFLHVRVLDCWLHEQDMRRATGRAGNLSGAAAEHTVDRLVRTIPIVVGKRAATPEGGAVAINITDGVERHIFCEVQNGRAKFVDDPSTAPLATIGLTTEAFIVLAGGRRTSDRVDAQISGDRELARRVLSQFNMMI
ncbi:MAG: maleylpyruvate isomerase family mycothiol-dependent enzyme [Ilumatobacteraceae bacterium]